jgi:transcriptional regulator with XRE-family HTH domain
MQLYSVPKHYISGHVGIARMRGMAQSALRLLESVATLSAMADARQQTELPDLRDLGAVLRALRRRADLSQRELAIRAGVPAGTVARIESGRAADPKFRTVERLVQAAGAALIVGEPTRDREAGNGSGDGQRDAAGRRYPAHLDVREVLTAKDWWGAWWAYWYDLPRERWPVKAPDLTYDLDRSRRDRRRRREQMRRQVTVRRAAQTEAPPNGWRLVAEGVDGAVVGELCAYLRRSRRGKGYEAVLADVEVLPQWRGLGIGRRLVAALRAEMTRAGVTTVHAVVEDGLGFLVRCGFTDESPRLVRLTLSGRAGSAGEGGRDGGERVEGVADPPDRAVAGTDQV